MKKIISVIIILVLIMSFSSCRKANEGTSSNASSIDDIETSMSQNSTEDDIQVSAPQSPDDETQLPPQNEEIVYQSTIDTPKEIIFYKDGKFGVSTNKKLNLNVAKCVEAWYKNYENDTLPLTKTAVSEEMIAKLKQSETVVEICFNYDQEINFCGKIELERTKRILIPLTGSQAYYVFRGNDAYSYQNGLHSVKGSGLEKYFDGVALDKEVRKWESTVITPTKVTFYKDGRQSVSTESDLNRKIAKYIESWFKYATQCTSFNSIITDPNITQQKYNTTAIELEFDAAFTFYGSFIQKNTRKIFITLDGEHPYTVFTNDGLYNTNWGNMSPVTRFNERNLASFFEGRKFEEIQPADRWMSTVYPPARIQLYKNGELLEEFADREFNHNVAKQIESWYLYEEEICIENTGIKNTTIDDIRKNETYIEVFFNSEIKFYGKHLSTKDDCCLLIPLTGDYAYFVFAASDDYNYDKYSFPEKSTNLESFFDALK